ncbi:MAG: hypothetical protein GY821_05110 [Gammaproteobacteria bacterium]|nr:hypothetical protein [Gammaproteobacteria bacterium]
MLHNNMLSDQEQTTALQLIKAIEESFQENAPAFQLLRNVVSAMQQLVNPNYDSFDNRLVTDEAIRSELQKSRYNVPKDQFEKIVKLVRFYVGETAIDEYPGKHEMEYAPRQMFIRQTIFDKFRPSELKLLDTIPANKKKREEN